MKNLLIFFLLCGVLLGSCNSGVENERISPKNLIAVSSFISPQDSLLKVYIFQGQPLENIVREDSALIKDAEVMILDDKESVKLNFNPKTKRYESLTKNFKIEEAKVYFLKIITKTGILLESSCKIPLSIAKPIINSNQDKDDYVFSLNWDYSPNYKYYTISALVDGFYLVQNRKTILYAELDIDRQSDFIEQKTNLNNIIEGKIRDAYKSDKIKMNISLTNVEDNSYNYLKTYQDFRNWNANNGDFIPNLREPQPIFSNIIGGVGIFGAYNQSNFEIIIK